MNMESNEAINAIKSYVSSDADNFLFRGQSQKYPFVVPTVHRASGLVRQQSYSILRRIQSVPISGLRQTLFKGASPETHQEIFALLRHYGWPTPILDLSNDLDVALFFACEGYDSSTGAAEIMVVDKSKIPTGMQLVDHSTYLNPDFNLRWQRQVGWALIPSWPGLDDNSAINLRTLDCVTCFDFVPTNDDLQNAMLKKPYYYATDEGMMSSVANLINLMAEEFHPLSVELRRFPF